MADTGTDIDQLAKNPNGKLPIPDDGGLVVWDSKDMVAHIAARAGW